MDVIRKSLKAIDLLTLLAWRLIERTLRLAWLLANALEEASIRVAGLSGRSKPHSATGHVPAGERTMGILAGTAKAGVNDFMAAMDKSPAARRLFFIALALIAFRVDLEFMAAPRGKWEPDGKAVASYYAQGFLGKPTASGEIFSPLKLTAAHKTLPFGTWVRVRNLLNGREAIVRINDRGPFIAGRDIDLSKAAARRIGILESGLAPVEMSILKKTR